MKHPAEQLGKVSPELIQGAINIGSGIIGNIGQPDEIKWSYPECGKRPFFIGRRRNEWQECVKNQKRLSAKNPVFLRNKEENFFSKNKSWLLPVGIGAAIFVIYKMKS